MGHSCCCATISKDTVIYDPQNHGKHDNDSPKILQNERRPDILVRNVNTGI